MPKTFAELGAFLIGIMRPHAAIGSRACHLLHAAANLFAADETHHEPVQIPAFDQSLVQRAHSREHSAGNQFLDHCESAVRFSHG
jgi:hypothetical protein